jgi:hypothetical protein
MFLVELNIHFHPIINNFIAIIITCQSQIYQFEIVKNHSSQKLIVCCHQNGSWIIVDKSFSKLLFLFRIITLMADIWWKIQDGKAPEIFLEAS